MQSQLDSNQHIIHQNDIKYLGLLSQYVMIYSNGTTYLRPCARNIGNDFWVDNNHKPIGKKLTINQILDMLTDNSNLKGCTIIQNGYCYMHTELNNIVDGYSTQHLYDESIKTGDYRTMILIQKN